MKPIIVLTALLSLFFFRFSFAQQAGYRLYTVSDGLVQSEVTALHQDTRGFLWIGTKNGISRFDGHSFQTIRDTAGISEGWVKYIQSLNDSTVWFMTTRGCLVYSYGFRTSVLRSFPYNDRVEGYWSADGKGYFVTAKAMLFKVDRNGLKQVKNSCFDQVGGMVRNDGWFNPSYSKRDGNFYFRTRDDKLACLRKNKILILKAKPFFNLFTGIDGRIYFVTPETNFIQLMFRDLNQSWENFHESNHENTKVWCISDTTVAQVEDFGLNPDVMGDRFLILNKDTLFFSSSVTPMLRLFANGKITDYRLPFSEVNAALLDREKNLWLGTPLGLVRLYSLGFTHFDESDGLYKNSQVVVEDKNQCIIVGGYDKGIQKIENGRIANIPMPAFSASGAEWCIYPGSIKEKNGNVDISITPYCMITWDGKKLQTIPGLPVAASFCFQEDTLARTLICGINTGLLKRKAGEKGYELVNVSPGKKENMVVALVMDTHRRLLLGGFKGLSFLDGTRLTHLPTKEFPYTQGANTMARDHRGNIWIGNSDGLWMFDMKKFRKIPNPWFNDIVVSMCLIDSSKLFIGGLHGIGFLDLNTFYRKDTAVIRFFNADNGFTGNECQQNAVCLDSRGILWVATTDNLQRIDPQNLPALNAGPQVYFEKISMLDETMKMVPLVVSSVSKGRLDLGPRDHNIRFDFTAPVFRGATFVRYRYMLDGQDKDWSQPTAERNAVYTNLAPGKYIFKVIACNDAGCWSANPASFEIVIRPAFWQTWWFILLMLIVLSGFFFGMGYLVMSRRKRTIQEKLESEKRIAELQLISIRNQIDPHFTFNAMNSIASVILKEEKEKAYSFFVKLSNLIRQVLTSGDNVTRTLAEEIVFVQTYLEIEKLRFRDSFHFTINIIQPVNLEQEVPKMVIQTYAENALKHGLLNKNDDTGELTVTIREETDRLYITVEDNGVGREEARRMKQNSTGKGMMILNFYYDFFDRYNEQKIFHEVTDLYHENNQPAGTRVTVIIPSGFKYNMTTYVPNRNH